MEEDRERRILGFGPFFLIKWALRGLESVCKGVMWLRSRYDQKVSQIRQQTRRVIEETNQMKKDIGDLRLQLKKSKSRARHRV